MKHWRRTTMTIGACVLLLGVAIAPTVRAEEGDTREFAGYGDSEAAACEEATRSMLANNSVPQGDGSCERCEAQHTMSYPFELNGQWFCAIRGVEGPSDEKHLVLPSSSEAVNADADAEADAEAEEADAEADADADVNADADADEEAGADGEDDP